jgi:ribosomal protein S18 acetylase RimI-like enzyme
MLAAGADPFDNVFWTCMAGAQAAIAVGTDRVRRFRPGFSPIAAFVDPQARTVADFSTLASLVGTGERFFVPQWSGPLPAGWTMHLDTTMLAMVWDGRAAPAVDPALGARPLTSADVPRMQDLAARTRPGPFGPRTIEFGGYHGVFDDDRLMAMAGRRLFDGVRREVSGICTEPAYQGRGLARRLSELIVSRIIEHGELPFLHVASANARAIGLYERLGFVRAREVAVRILSRNA